MYEQTKPRITHQQLRTPNPTKDKVIAESPVLNAFILVHPEDYFYPEEESFV